MILLLVSMYLGQMAGKDLTLYSEVTLGLSTQLVLVLLGIFFYPFHQIQQFSPLGHYFASASHDRTARIWSVDRIQPLRIMAEHLSDVDCIRWHSNCNYIATGYSDKTVRLWDVQSGECVRIFIGHRSVVLSLAMSPDGRYMASGDEDGTIMMWDLSSGRYVTPLMVKCSILVLAIVFSKESSLCCWGSFKKCIKRELHKYSLNKLRVTIDSMVTIDAVSGILKHFDRGCSGNSIIRLVADKTNWFHACVRYIYLFLNCPLQNQVNPESPFLRHPATLGFV
ncbi:hypothetical protein TEA_022551 [Camellia sinensis var. sinensis]|uniref:Uncharacterized protein n=1 Tax=Camellia sinensis var. sinensis TaxID=542762 RepID=A0A4S4D2J4_CAMSN|nr:hypothetical protein TEA_022551 [Camellia sinensis var. sinensis]